MGWSHTKRNYRDHSIVDYFSIRVTDGFTVGPIMKDLLTNHSHYKVNTNK